MPERFRAGDDARGEKDDEHLATFLAYAERACAAPLLKVRGPLFRSDWMTSGSALGTMVLSAATMVLSADTMVLSVATMVLSAATMVLSVATMVPSVDTMVLSAMKARIQWTSASSVRGEW